MHVLHQYCPNLDEGRMSHFWKFWDFGIFQLREASALSTKSFSEKLQRKIFFSMEACAIKFPLWKQYCNWKSEYGKYVFNIRPLSRFTLTCFHYPDFDIHLLPFSRLYCGTYFLFPEFKYQLMCALTCNLYILPI